MTYLAYTVNTMVAEYLETQAAQSLAAIVLTSSHGIFSFQQQKTL